MVRARPAHRGTHGRVRVTSPGGSGSATPRHHSGGWPAIGTGETFRRARDLAAWLGLVPRQATTGGKPRLLGITKRGNTYLRTLLIHGARAALPSLTASQSPMGEWLRGLVGRAHKNKVVVALAGKLARIAWAVL